MGISGLIWLATRLRWRWAWFSNWALSFPFNHWAQKNWKVRWTFLWLYHPIIVTQCRAGGWRPWWWWWWSQAAAGPLCMTTTAVVAGAAATATAAATFSTCAKSGETTLRVAEELYSTVAKNRKWSISSSRAWQTWRLRLRSVVSLYGRGRCCCCFCRSNETMHSSSRTAAPRLTAHDDDSRPLQIETNGLIIKSKTNFLASKTYLQVSMITAFLYEKRRGSVALRHFSKGFPVAPNRLRREVDLAGPLPLDFFASLGIQMMMC